MMSLKPAMGVCAVLAMVAAATNDNDTWRIKQIRGSDRVEFRIERKSGRSQWSHNSEMRLDAFRGLTRQALEGTGPANFELARDAGTIVFEGRFSGGSGTGTYTIRPNDGYSTQIRGLGYEEPSEHERFSMILTDVSLDFARNVKQADPKATTRNLVEMRIHGITSDYMARMRATGYTDLTARNYVEMKIHNVTPELVAELKKAGYAVPAQKIVEMKIHGVSPEYIAALKGHGLQPDAREIVEMRIHGVTPEYLKGFRDSGYGAMTVRQVVEMKIHGVSPEFAREAKQLGYTFTPRQLTEMRIHGVDVAYLKKLQQSGFKNLDAEKIVRLKIHGID